MDFFYFIIAAVFIVGIAIILVSAFSGKSGEDAETTQPNTNSAILDYMKLNAKMKDVDEVINEADSVLTEINDVSKNVLTEIDKKHEEMLFLYNLLGEKEKSLTASEDQSRAAEIKHAASSKAKSFFPQRRNKVDYSVSEDYQKEYKNPKLLQIQELKEQGFPIAEIAKRLDMGKGEVSIILALSATGNGGAGDE